MVSLQPLLFRVFLFDLISPSTLDVVRPIGSTSIYTPKVFIQDLSQLDRGGPSGLKPEPKPSRPPSKKAPDPRERLQAADDRYAYTEPVPRPQPRRPNALPDAYATQPRPPDISPLPSPALAQPPPPSSSTTTATTGKVEKEKKKGFFGRSKK